MKDKTTLKRLERTLNARRPAQDDFAKFEQAKLDAMTDDELARYVETLAIVVELVDAGLNDETTDHTVKTSSARTGTATAGARR